MSHVVEVNQLFRRASVPDLRVFQALRVYCSRRTGNAERREAAGAFPLQLSPHLASLQPFSKSFPGSRFHRWSPQLHFNLKREAPNFSPTSNCFLNVSRRPPSSYQSVCWMDASNKDDILPYVESYFTITLHFQHNRESLYQIQKHIWRKAKILSRAQNFH